MSNPPTPTATSAPKVIPAHPVSSDEFDLAGNPADPNYSQSQRPGRDDSSEDGADTVEIGDPVPEDDRIVRADSSDEDSPIDADGDDQVDPDPSSERH